MDKPNFESERKIVFVCTGNVFRSMTAMFAARACHAVQKGDLKLAFESAGTRGRPAKAVRHDVSAHARQLGFDTAVHESRKLTREIVDNADLIIAMDSTHQSFIRDEFGVHAPLYLEIADGRKEDILDLPDVIPDFKDKPAESEAFIKNVMDGITAKSSRFLTNLPKFLDKTL